MPKLKRVPLPEAISIETTIQSIAKELSSILLNKDNKSISKRITKHLDTLPTDLQIRLCDVMIESVIHISMKKVTYIDKRSMYAKTTEKSILVSLIDN